MPFKRLVVLLLLVVACSQAEIEDASLGVTWRKIQRNVSVAEITLSDGTRCAVVDGVRANGIDCDWGER